MTHSFNDAVKDHDVHRAFGLFSSLRVSRLRAY